MQNAKDTFYEVLRDRVAAGNAARTVVLRGVLRPGVLVEENEVASSAELLDCFRLRWASLRVEDGAAPLAVMGCEVRYATKGSAGGLDRGRALAAMDAELWAALEASPPCAVKKSFTNGGAELGSRVWWGAPVFAAVTAVGAELQRVATLTVYSYEEAGEA